MCFWLQNFHREAIEIDSAKSVLIQTSVIALVLFEFQRNSDGRVRVKKWRAFNDSSYLDAKGYVTFITR